MTERPLSRRDQASLVRLADGTLTARAQARLRAIPDADRLAERQRRVTRALGAGEELPPLSRPVARPTRAWQLAPRFVAAGVLSAVLIALVVLAPDGGRTTVERAADIARLPATQEAPAESGPVLGAAVDGVAFPDWGPEFGWEQTGMRRDQLDGRPTATVFYEHTGHRLAYTIVSGPALPRPDGARVVRRDGLEIALYRDPRHGGHEVAVFERGGRTCVVAGHVMKLETLIKLAAWKGGGSVRA